MALFDRVEQIPANEVPALLPDPDGAWIGPLQPGISYSEYQAMAERVLRLIGAGDIYQANLTFHGHVATEGDPLALYAKLRGAAGAGWGAVDGIDRLFDMVTCHFGADLSLVIDDDSP